MQCISSIECQNYINIEIVAVDDGSNDHTGEIIDRLSVKDERVRPMHQTNMGVSNARNNGMKAAKGDYIVFVDGDDYISPDFTDYMLSLVMGNDADFALSLNCFTRQLEPQISHDEIKNVTSEEATALLLGPRVVVGCWNKIYKTSFLKENGIKFSVDLFYGEGLHFISNVAQTATKITVGNRRVYFYRRNNYASTCSHFKIENFYNGLESINAIEKQMIINSPRIMDMLRWHRCQFKMGAVVRMKSAGVNKLYGSFYTECLKYVREHMIEILKIREVGIYKKCLIIGTAFSPYIMSKLDNFRRKRIQRYSIC